MRRSARIDGRADALKSAASGADNKSNQHEPDRKGFAVWNPQIATLGSGLGKENKWSFLGGNYSLSVRA